MTLRKHLCTDDDVDFACEDALVQLAPRVFARKRIGIGAGDARVGKRFNERGLEFLRTHARADKFGVSTCRTPRRHVGLQSAVMTPERARCLVQCELRVTARTRCAPAAMPAIERRREATAIDEHKTLFAALESLGNAFGERLRQTGFHATATRRNEPQRRRRGRGGPLV